MELFACGHSAAAADSRMCAHLLAEESPDYVSLLTGVGIEYDLLCRDCADSTDPRSHLRRVCVGSVGRVQDDNQRLAWRGEPEVRDRDGDLAGSWMFRASPVVPVNARCLAALPDGWLVLTGAGLVELAESGPAWPVELVVEEPENWAGHQRGPGLHVSPDGRFAAVVTDYGRYGVLLDRRTGTVVRQLDRGEHQSRTQPFPIAFVERDGATILIAGRTGTGWTPSSPQRASA